MSTEEVKRKLTAIFSADVKGYSRLMGEDEKETVRTLNAYKGLMTGLIQHHHGRVVDAPGDNLMAEFASVVDAVECAVEIQRELKNRNAELPENRRMEFRIGVNLGDVIEEGDKIYGDGVNIAARMESLADGGGICISGTAYDQVENKLGLGYKYLGEQAVKNIAKPVRVYRVAVPTPAAYFMTAEKPSIAVLPFVNMSGDPEQEYFSDGITEDIITALSRLHWFLVIARNSTFSYKGKPVDVKQIGRELGVRYILEGSIRKIGNRVRITAQLINATTGAHLWAERYDRELNDIFALQDEITQSVTAAIEPKLVEAESVHFQGRSPEDLDAWDLVMRAVASFWRMTMAESEAAIDMLRLAVERYPNYAPAQSMLAFALLVSDHVGWAPSGKPYRLAANLAHRAAELDDNDPWAHLALGYLAFTAQQTDDAVRQFKRALDLNPNFAAAYGYLGWAVVFDGRHEEAIEYFQQAFRMSPHDPLIAFFYAGMCAAHYFARRFNEAVEWGRKSIQQRPGFIAGQRILCASLAQAGRTEELRAAMARLHELQPDITIAWLEEHVPYTPRAIAHYLDGMRKAGVE
jgi:TolB-like protein/class 3 adenylate cyclase/Tfp pilus assembly protein PilF